LERIEGALLAAVKRRLVADVPVGVLLSGGVDSSLVTALAARAAGSVKTFSVATEDPALDESAYARSVAERYGTEHHALPVRGSVRQELTGLVAAMGEPLADPSAANQFAIARMARETVTVVLTGDGGDEGFGGYSHMWAHYHAGRLRGLLPGLLRSPLGGMAAMLRRGPGAIRKAGTLLQLAAAPVEKTFGETGWLDQPTLAALYTPEFQARLDGHRPTEHYWRVLKGSDAAPPVDRVMQAQLQTILPDDYLTKVDVATMGASLEARSPFLDLDVVELAMRIPAVSRFSGGQPKGLLRRLARRYLPAEGVDRPKQGFVAPVGRWLREEWTDLVDDLVLGPHVEQRGWFRRRALQRLVNQQRQGANLDYLLWALMVLELWLRMSIDRTLLPSDTL
jgi:asparagine synthase (glutamine-hydrolysing)